MRRFACIACAFLLTLAASAQDQAYLLESPSGTGAGGVLYTVDLTSGRPTPVGSYVNNGLSDPRGLAWRPDTQVLWTIDQSTGTLGVLHPSTAIFLPRHVLYPARWIALAWDTPSARLYLLESQTGGGTLLHSFDPATSVFAPIGRFGFSNVSSLDSDGAGFLWAIDRSTQSLLRIQPTNASARRMAPTVALITGLGIDEITGAHHAVTQGFTPALYEIDPVSGQAQVRGGLAISYSSGFTVVDGACRAAFDSFGSGCAGSVGIVPILGAFGCFGPGGDVIVALRQVAGNGVALLLFGLGGGPLPLGNGCDLLLSPIVAGPMAVPLLGGFGPGSAFANLTFRVPAPFSPGTFAVQSLIVDPGASGGFAASNGVSFTVY